VIVIVQELIKFVSEATGTTIVVDPETMQVHRVDVEIGEATGDHILITKGLAKGDRVAIAGAHFLQEGQEVKTLAPSSKAAPEAEGSP